MKDLPYSKFLDIIAKRTWEDDFYDDFQKVLEESIDSTTMVCFYPRYIFIPEQPLEVIFFNKESLTIVSRIEKEKVDLQIKKYNSITNVRLETNGRYNPVKLLISFNDDLQIVLDPKEDTITNWVNRYSDNVKNIFKLFQI